MAATLKPGYIPVAVEGEEDIETKALRRQQAEIADAAREGAEHATSDEEAEAMDRRAEKAEYLKQKLDERAEAEKEKEADD